MGDIPSISELFLNLSPSFKSGRACQILFLILIKDGPADNRNEFIYGGSSNKTVILQ